MNAMRRMGLAVATMVIGALAAGCAAAPGPTQVTPSEYPAGAAATAGAYGGDLEAPAPPASIPKSPAVHAEGRAHGADEPSARRPREEKEQPSPRDRPGLGTEWGETRVSRISTVPFVRADASSPFATSMLFYNDEEGARAMSSLVGFRRTAAGAFSIGGGVVSIGLRDERGSFLTGFVSGAKNFAVGEVGRRYTIVVKNHTDSRLEVVLSVDGLDVIDGRPASFNKRGYLVDPHAELEVDGFRQSTDTVAAFRFGSVRNSYAAQKSGDTRNVGVVGVALFNERGTNPFPWTADELQRRRDANPFPGQFATPPGY